MLRISYEACVDEKSERYKTCSVEVEVGVYGKWASYRSIAGKGHRVLQSGSPVTGYVLTAKVRSQEKILGMEKAYDYSRPQWQCFASACVIQHVVTTILNSLPAEQRGEAYKKIRVEPLANHALYPLRTQVRTQSASGVECHLLVTGVLFESTDDDAAGGLGLVRCPPISTRGKVPSGKLDAGGTKPTVCEGQIHFSMRDLSTKPKIKGGYYYCPAALETTPGHESWPESKSPQARTERRAQMRKAQKARIRGREEESEGEFSDGGASTTSSVRKLARTASAQLGISLRPHGNTGSSPH